MITPRGPLSMAELQVGDEVVSRNLPFSFSFSFLKTWPYKLWHAFLRSIAWPGCLLGFYVDVHTCNVAYILGESAYVLGIAGVLTSLLLGIVNDII